VAVVSLSAIACVIISRGVSVSKVVAGPSDSVDVRTPVKAHLRDGAIVVYPRGVLVTRNRLIGVGTRHDAMLLTAVPAQEIPLDSVVGVEAFTTQTDSYKTMAYTAIGTVLTLGAAIGLFVATFGSCPTVYSDSAGRSVLEAEAFSYSISPLLEARDVDRLHAHPDSGGILRLDVRNEALETHYVNHIELIEAVHTPDEYAVPDVRGEPIAVRHFVEPVSVRDRAGHDLRSTLGQSDSAAFRTDSATLARATAVDPDDYIDIVAVNEGDADSLAIVLTLRNSLLNTVLLYDLMLGQPGARSIDWIAADLQHIGPAVDLVKWYGKYFGMRILAHDGREWKQVGRLADVGPIAWRDVGIVVPAPPGDTVRIRLAFLADQWRIDRIALATAVRHPTTRVIPISTVSGADGANGPALLAEIAHADERYVETSPGQRFTISFDAGRTAAGLARTFFLGSQGYYTEWVRGGWLTGVRDTSTFKPTNLSLEHLLHTWIARRASMEAQFFKTRIPVR
jgi:hypothetical protein